MPSIPYLWKTENYWNSIFVLFFSLSVSLFDSYLETWAFDCIVMSNFKICYLGCLYKQTRKKIENEFVFANCLEKTNCCNCTLFVRFHIWRKYESKSPVQKPACITCLHDFFWSTILCHLHLWSEYCHLPVVVLWQNTEFRRYTCNCKLKDLQLFWLIKAIWF